MDKRTFLWLVVKVSVVSTAVYLFITEDKLVRRPHNTYINVDAPAESNGRKTKKPSELCILNTDVVSIYTPACGSRVVQSVLFRFGYSNDLLVTLTAKPGNPSFAQDFKSRDIRNEDIIQPSAMISQEWTTNIIAHQVRYNRDALQKIVKGNASYITILRNPLDRFETDFMSYKFEKQFDVEPKSSPSALERYLRAPEFWEKRRMHVNSRCTSNCMAKALGIPVGEGMKISPGSGHKALMDYIEKLDSEFALVLIYERLNQSLVLLKRYMCLSVKDILYDVELMEPPATQRDIREEHKNVQFRRVNGADHLLYYYFYDIFLAKVAAEGAEFDREVKQFKSVLDNVSRFCSSAIKDLRVANQEVIFGSEWDDEFVVTRRMCLDLKRNRNDWGKLFRGRYSL